MNRCAVPCSPVRPSAIAASLALLAACCSGGTIRAAPSSPANKGQAAASAGPLPATVTVLEHVDVIDGTGAPPLRDRNVRLAGGKIVAIAGGTDEPARAGTAVLHLRGHTVMPGIVGMHDHLWYSATPNFTPDGKWDKPEPRLDLTFSAPRLYLAGGVTTIRTAGSANPYADVELARAIEKGDVPGPHLDVTGPYLDGPTLTGPEDAARTVAFWADHGVTSFKAYSRITRAELTAVVAEAHRRGLKVLGHLCSVTYPEAVEAGIDSLEHGFSANTQLDHGKKPDECSESAGDETLEAMTPDGPEARQLIALLVQHHVAVTSTMPLRASGVPGAPLPPRQAFEAMSAEAREGYMIDRERDRRRAGPNRSAQRLRRDMDLQRAFVAAGGLLLAGADAVGIAGNLPGFGNHREIELLVEAGFSPVEAIRIATYNGAVFLGRDDRIGSVAPGKNADLVVVRGDPSAHIADIENVTTVFRDGTAYDPAKLYDTVRGHYGQY